MALSIGRPVLLIRGSVLVKRVGKGGAMEIFVNGINVHYVTAGADDAPWVTLSHSIAADHTFWDAEAAALAAGYRVLRYDTRGHGMSAVGTDPTSLDLLARDVIGLWDGLSIARSHFIGLSLGGMIGLVLGLDRGGACRGMAYRIAAAEGAGVLDYLDARERVTEVYVRRTVPITVGGLKVKAETYLADREHYQYAGKQTLKDAAALIAQGTGVGGSNRDYLESTVNHLDALGITDGPLHRLHAMVRGTGSCRL